MPIKNYRIGIVSTRLAGTDGVSLEVVKWVKVLEKALGHECFFFAGESEWPADHSYTVPEAHFEHPEVKALTAELFDDYIRSQETSAAIEKIKNHLKHHLYKFYQQFDIDLLIIENAMAIPMNIPLGLALTELLAETSLPTIGHHHDFAWERTRYSVGAADDYLRARFRPRCTLSPTRVARLFLRLHLTYWRYPTTFKCNHNSFNPVCRRRQSNEFQTKQLQPYQ